MKTYQVNEIFSSVQGEGVWTGVPATFVRLQGCTVGCPWCDTKYTWKKGGTRMVVADIMSEVVEHHVVITGGEPTMYNLDDLILALHEARHYVQLETSGQQWLKGLLLPDWITVSPKRNLGFRVPEQYHSLADEVKFVIDSEISLCDVYRALDFFLYSGRSTHIEISIMPEGAPPTELSMRHAMQMLHLLANNSVPHVRFGDRLQYRLGVK
jgi:7-carboxy-7-deazaguanine synthase